MSSQDAPRLPDYLDHILVAIDRISTYTSGCDSAGFRQNSMLQDAVIRNIEVIGEACNNIDKRHPDFKVRFPEIPLLPAYQMRNYVAHGYFKVDLDTVWKTVKTDLPALHDQIRAAKAAVLGAPSQATRIGTTPRPGRG